MLIDNDAEVTAKDDYGSMALHRAAWHGHSEAIFILSNTPEMKPGANGGVLDVGFSNVLKLLDFLMTKFSKDHLISAALGKEFHLQKMYSEAMNSYDASICKLVGTRAGIVIEYLESPLLCDECRQLICGYHYKCKGCY